MEQAVVLETGVRHHYEVEASGWARQSSGELKRVTEQGIRLRVTRHDRTPHVAGQAGLLPETYETVTTAAFLLPGNSKAAARWEELRGIASAREAEQAARMAAAAELRMRFADAGFEVMGGGEHVIFKGEDAERLLAALAGSRTEQETGDERDKSQGEPGVRPAAAARAAAKASRAAERHSVAAVRAGLPDDHPVDGPDPAGQEQE
jgi:hypothetical protein